MTNSPILTKQDCNDLTATLKKIGVTLTLKKHPTMGYWGSVKLPNLVVDEKKAINDLMVELNSHSNPVMHHVAKALALFTHAPVGYEPNGLNDGLLLTLSAIFTPYDLDSTSLPVNEPMAMFFEYFRDECIESYVQPLSALNMTKDTINEDDLDSYGFEAMIESPNYGYELSDDDYELTDDSVVTFYVRTPTMTYENRHPLSKYVSDIEISDPDVIHETLFEVLRDWRNENLSTGWMIASRFHNQILIQPNSCH